MKKLFPILLCYLASGLFFLSPQPRAKSPDSISITRTEQVAISYSRKKQEKPSFREKIWSWALDKGIKKIYKTWLGRRLLVENSNASIYKSNPRQFIKQRGEIVFSDSEEILPTQRFQVSVSFAPIKQVSGRVVKIEKDRTIAGEYSQVSIKLAHLRPSGKAYFLIARPEVIENKNYMRVIGSGKIFNTLKDLAQAKLMTLSQEIMLEDRVYLLQTQITPTNEQNKINPTQTETENRVVVKPLPEPEEDKPQVAK